VKIFEPHQVIFRENALEYPLARKMYKKFEEEGYLIKKAPAKGRLPIDYDKTFQQKYNQAKKTILVAVRSTNNFASCKPSAHYQLPLISGCPAHCHYCYLNTNMGKAPYIRIYVNHKEIFAKAEEYIAEREPETTIFEGAATSDPLPVEKWSGSLTEAIKFFAKTKNARFRFVSKFTEIEPFLNLDHKKQTEIRFSLNSKHIINTFEKGTPQIDERLKAATMLKNKGYPVGFLIAPIFTYPDWQKDYEELIKKISLHFKDEQNLTFELITHRFTDRAKNIIEKIYPKNKLPLDKNERQFKYGQFGYGKYLYPAEKYHELENYFQQKINDYLPDSKIKYFV